MCNPNRPNSVCSLILTFVIKSRDVWSSDERTEGPYCQVLRLYKCEMGLHNRLVNYIYEFLVADDCLLDCCTVQSFVLYTKVSEENTVSIFRAEVRSLYTVTKVNQARRAGQSEP
jgi:hypothetical protein